MLFDPPSKGDLTPKGCSRIALIGIIAGLYDFDIEFDSGLSLSLNLYSQWPECPDRDVTEQEILEYIRLDSVSAWRTSDR